MTATPERAVSSRARQGGTCGLFTLAIGIVLTALAGQSVAQEKVPPEPASTSQPAVRLEDVVPNVTKEILGGDGSLESPAPPTWKKPIPMGCTVEYSLLSDYVCRKGFNLSEYPGEKGEKPNHQLLVAPYVSTKDVFGKGTDFGTFSLPSWFEFYDGQPHLTPQSDNKFQEYDFMPTWTYAIPTTPLTFSFTNDYYDLPRAREAGVSRRLSQGDELWFTLALDDSFLCGKPLLSPYVTYVQDVDNVRGGWFDIGIKHDFKLSEMGCKSVPILKDLTLTPGVVFGIDHRYVDECVGNDLGTHFSTINYGLTGTYDLNSALNIPQKYGSIYLKGFINFKEQVHDYHVQGPFPVLRDTTYGGVSIGYSW